MLDLNTIKTIINHASPSLAAELLVQLEDLPHGTDSQGKISQLKLLLRQRLLSSIDIRNVPQSPLPELMDARDVSVSRLFFEPFESLFEDFKENRKPLPGSFNRENLAKIWQIFREKLAPEELAQIEPKAIVALTRHDSISAANYAAKMREICNQKTIDKAPDFLSQMDKSIDKDAGIRFLQWLQVEAEARERKINVTADLSDIADNDISEYCYYLTNLDKRNINAASDFLLVLMGNSHKPWTILRIIRAAVSGMNDRKLAATAYDIIGIRLIALLERKIEQIDAMRKAPNFDGYDLAQLVEAYSQMSMGIERSSILIDGGPWFKALIKVRHHAADVFSQLCDKAEDSIANAFPVDKVRIKGIGAIDLPRVNNELNMDKVVIAREFARFIRSARLYAPNAGFGGMRDNVQKAMLRHCDWLKNGLITLVNNGEKGNHFAEWSKHVVELLAIVDDAAAAKSLERKLAA